MNFPHCTDALEYAEKIVSKEILACQHTINACKRFLSDLEKSQDKDWPYYFDSEAAEKAVNFAELMPHTKGRWAQKGQNLKAEPWQKFFFCNIFGWKKKSDDKRRFREVYCKVPRKNGKSFLAATVGNKMFVADGEYGAEVYSGATTEKQAWEVFRPAKMMAQKSDEFRERFDIEVNAKNMCVLSDGSRFEPLVGNPGDGSSPSCAIVDEYHEHDKDDLYETMVTGMGAREQPLMLVITTAGSNLGGPCYEKERDAIKVLNGSIEDERLFVLIYGIDDDDQWDSEEALIKANPNYGVSVSEEFLLQQLAIARRSASKQNAYRTKHLNQWVGAKTAWMNMLAWQRAKKKIKIEDFLGLECHLALDLASKKDLAALTFLFKKGNKYHTFSKYYVPESAVLENDKYQEYQNSGHLTVTPGNMTDYDYIKEDILQAYKDFDVRSTAYDPFQATYLVQKLMEEGVENLVEYKHTVLNMSEPMKELEALILDGKLFHDGNPCTTWQMGNVTAKQDIKENIYPNKEAPNDHRCKIDGVVALIMAMGRWMQDNEDDGGLDDFLADPVII